MEQIPYKSLKLFRPRLNAKNKENITMTLRSMRFSKIRPSCQRSSLTLGVKISAICDQKCQFLTIFIIGIVLMSVSAQVPSALTYSIPPPTGSQGEALLGSSVAVEGSYAVAGAPADDIGGSSSGVVKVFDSTSGALLYLIPNPSPGANDNFGTSVALSGTRLVVGATGNSTGGISAGSAYVYELDSTTPMVPTAVLNNPNPGPSDYFGNAVAISGTRVVVGALFDDTTGSDSGSAYIYDLVGVAPTLPIATLSNPSPADGDFFGKAVAISGTRVVVGANKDDTGVSNSGSAYVYDVASDTPALPTTILNNPTPSANDEYGISVSISGMRLVVGAYGDDTGFTDSGCAYVYNLGSATPAVPLTVNNPTPAANDQFGLSVSISGLRWIIGARGNNSGEWVYGSAYVYDLNGTVSPFLTTILNNPTPAVGDQFGFSVAIAGTQVIVGAHQDDTGASDAGSAYLYSLTSPSPTIPLSTLNYPAPSANDNFGNSVAISGTKMVVGASEEDTGAENSGAVYVYDLSGPSPLTPVATLMNPTPYRNDHFGIAVAISGTRIIVGAYGDNTAGWIQSGSAYVYDLASATPTIPIAVLSNPSPANNDNFGKSVGISGTRVVIGVHADDTGATDSGIAYVYDIVSSTPLIPVATLNNPSPSAGDNFGNAVAISGTRLIVGASGDNSSNGSVFAYDLSSSTPTFPMILSNPGAFASLRFGISTAISGARVVVGATNGNNGNGGAYVYNFIGLTPNLPIATLSNPVQGATDYFGNSVAISGVKIVVGAYGDDTGLANSGKAYIYDFDGSTQTTPAFHLYNPTPGLGDNFGSSVAISGLNVAIGSPGDDTAFTDKGYAYVYSPSSAPQSEISLSVQPFNTNIVDGGYSNLGASVVGSPINSIFTIKNTGNENLTGLGITIGGPDASMFTVISIPASPVAGPLGSTEFVIRFVPSSSGAKTAALHISSNDADENPFDINLSGMGLSSTADTDSDGLNDAAELKMVALGFNWQIGQPELVNNYFGNAEVAGLFTLSQIQAIHINIPTLHKNSGSGLFKLKIGIQQSTDLINFSPFPVTSPKTSITGDGKIEFEFEAPDNAAFYRLLAE